MTNYIVQMNAPIASFTKELIVHAAIEQDLVAK
jgi:hypothetical protein